MHKIKAYVGGVAAAATYFGGALADGFDGSDLVGALIAGLSAFSAVYWAPKNAEPQ